MEAMPVQYVPALSRAASRFVRNTNGFIPAIACSLESLGIQKEEAVCFVFASLVDTVFLSGYLTDDFPWVLTDRSSTLAFVLELIKSSVNAFPELYGKEDLLYVRMLSAFMDWEGKGWTYSGIYPDPNNSALG